MFGLINNFKELKENNNLLFDFNMYLMSMICVLVLIVGSLAIKLGIVNI